MSYSIAKGQSVKAIAQNWRQFARGWRRPLVKEKKTFISRQFPISQKVATWLRPRQWGTKTETETSKTCHETSQYHTTLSNIIPM